MNGCEPLKRILLDIDRLVANRGVEATDACTTRQKEEDSIALCLCRFLSGHPSREQAAVHRTTSAICLLLEHTRSCFWHECLKPLDSVNLRLWSHRARLISETAAKSVYSFRFAIPKLCTFVVSSSLRKHPALRSDGGHEQHAGAVGRLRAAAALARQRAGQGAAPIFSFFCPCILASSF